MVKGLCLLLAQEGLMVILEAMSIIVDVVTQINMVMDALLLSRYSKSNGGQDAEGC